MTGKHPWPTLVAMDTLEPVPFPAGMTVHLRARARSQGYAFTRQQAVRLGASDEDLRRWVRAREAVSAGTGCYYLPGGTEDPDHVSDRRARAVLLTLDHRAALSHETALIAHGLPVWRRTDLRTHVCSAGERVRTRRKDVVYHHVSHDVPTSSQSGVKLVAASWAIAQVGAMRGVDHAVVAADAALRRGLCTPTDLTAACRALRSTRGGAHLATVPDLADGRSESPGESVVRLILVGAGIAVTPQCVIRTRAGEFVARVDLGVDGTRVLVEFDGLLKYRGTANAGALVAEKRRELALSRLGYTVVRVVWEDLTDPSRVLQWVRAALEG